MTASEVPQRNNMTDPQDWEWTDEKQYFTVYDPKTGRWSKPIPEDEVSEHTAADPEPSKTTNRLPKENV